MARIRKNMPKVFVGHPFGGRFSVTKFRRIFKELPFNVQYGNTNLQTRHLLVIMKDNIKKSDFSIFDLSDWNPNVALELGITEGLKKQPNKNYYILLNTRRSKEVPSDIRGLQRLEYTSYDYRKEVGLGDLLVSYILMKEYWVKELHKEISGKQYPERKLLLALKILAHLRDYDKLTLDNIKTLVRGTRLRQENREEVLGILHRLRLIKRIRNTSVYRRGRNIFK